jgi:hypothetical protein
MVILDKDTLVFRFPEIHPEAELKIRLKRTLRIPNNGRDYPLPPGLGNFPLRHVEDYAGHVSERWNKRGGVILPIYESEALWIDFTCFHPFVFAVKIGTGKICAVSGKQWSNGLIKEPQNYVIPPIQHCLDGYCVEQGIIRQFVATPIEKGVTTEKQLTGKVLYGGLQIEVFPLKKYVIPEKAIREDDLEMPLFSRKEEMGCAPGGSMRQKIYKDNRPLSDWALDQGSRCFVHLCNTMTWTAITGEAPTMHPPSTQEYAKAELPWFEYYAEKPVLKGSGILSKLKSIANWGKPKKTGAKEDATEGIDLKKIDEKTVKYTQKGRVVKEFKD